MAKRGTNERNRRRKEAKQKEEDALNAAYAADKTRDILAHSSIAITENDLLAFQFSHFGDDTKPNTWFVDAEEALGYVPADEDDGLGYYDDGEKRTLTDEQVDMFRHSEIEQLIREGLLGRDEEGDARDSEMPEDNESKGVAASDASSVEEELLSIAAPTRLAQSVEKVVRQPSPSIQSAASETSSAMRKRREKEIPYEERNKRKWEGYVEDTDPMHGSRTHRRIVRELDEQRVEDVELEY